MLSAALVCLAAVVTNQVGLAGAERLRRRRLTRLQDYLADPNRG